MQKDIIRKTQQYKEELLYSDLRPMHQIQNIKNKKEISIKDQRQIDVFCVAKQIDIYEIIKQFNDSNVTNHFKQEYFCLVIKDFPENYQTLGVRGFMKYIQQKDGDIDPFFTYAKEAGRKIVVITDLGSIVMWNFKNLDQKKYILEIFKEFYIEPMKTYAEDFQLYVETHHKQKFHTTDHGNYDDGGYNDSSSEEFIQQEMRDEIETGKKINVQQKNRKLSTQQHLIEQKRKLAKNVNEKKKLQIQKEFNKLKQQNKALEITKNKMINFNKNLNSDQINQKLGNSYSDEKLDINIINNRNKNKLQDQLNQDYQKRYLKNQNKEIIQSAQIEGNIVIVRNSDILEKITISYILGQSIKLELYEDELDDFIDENKNQLQNFNEQMKKKIMGKIMYLKYMVNLQENFFDVPDFVEDEEYLELLYQNFSCYFEIEERLELVNNKLNNLNDFIDEINSGNNQKNSFNLEYMIILIMLTQVSTGILNGLFSKDHYVDI
ncbi:hypothetical protein PPERSA_13107 [Pseudocohnilembus persalinus]|uniref:DUF155 domain-containing protein n=1 Tax=Pseudocohnilembus persalinus TaxID=266149 RepID=A0A0V0QWQ4_PSEPJ|nr:hypothetical protein PPERSA_13107 [Pseudocohnilembus persalinus]|eukprot:KRX06628.1 hypothetical protein PPERSA_13107 [Pseudocohnilembus persalinus]